MNILGEGISLSSYTENNHFTCPSDGYVNCTSTSNNGSCAFVATKNKNNLQVFVCIAYGNSSYSETRTTFVRKGMKIYVGISNGTAVYYPFTN